MRGRREVDLSTSSLERCDSHLAKTELRKGSGNVRVVQIGEASHGDGALGREMYTIAFLSHHGRSGWVGDEPKELPKAIPPTNLDERFCQ